MQDQATKQPREWWVMSLLLKLRADLIAGLETRIKSRTDKLPLKIPSGLILLTCFLLWHCLRPLGLLWLPFCGPLGWLLHTLFLHQRSWFSHGLMKCFVPKQGKGVGPSFVWLPVTVKDDLLTQRPLPVVLLILVVQAELVGEFGLLPWLCFTSHSGPCWEQDSSNWFWKSQVTQSKELKGADTAWSPQI